MPEKTVGQKIDAAVDDARDTKNNLKRDLSSEKTLSLIPFPFIITSSTFKSFKISGFIPLNIELS